MSTASVYLHAAKNILCGQTVSLFSLLALVMAKRLVYHSVNTPVLLNAFFYAFLSVMAFLCNCITPAATTSAVLPNGNTRRTIPWWVYPCLAVIDMHANVCAVTALQYTSFVTAGLTLNLAVPFVFILSVGAFRASFKWQHCLGCFVTNEVYGWGLAVLAAMLYAGSTVLNQWCMQQRGLDGVLECLSKVGAWATLFCIVEATLSNERHEIRAIVWDEKIVLLFTGYVLCMFAFYTAVFVLVEATESMLYNASLLSTTVYLMLLSYHALDETLDVSTYAGALTMLTGLAIYTLTRDPVGRGTGTSGGLPQISFKSMHTPRELVPNKLQLAQV